MKNIFTSVLPIFVSAACLSLLSCQKTEVLNDPLISMVGASNKGGTGGGKNGGGGAVTPTPTDTTTSSLPIADIITVGRWKVSSFVQGHDNNTSQFGNYMFSFNSDGSMFADNNGEQTTGAWHYQDAVFYYGIPVYGSSPYGFTISIGSGLPLTNLNENYFISKKTLTTIYIDSINPSENAHVVLSKL